MSRLILPLLCLLTLLVGPASAQIYSWTDTDGNRIFSDKPQPGASTVELRPTNVVQPNATEASPHAEQDSQSAAPAEPPYQRLAITSPADDSAIRSNEGDLSITVVTEPPLSGGHLLKLSIDGVLSQSGVPGTGAASHQLRVQDIDRGSHEVAAVVVNVRGEEIQRSPAITLHLQRTSINQPARRGTGN